MFVRAYAYMLSHGSDGLRQVSSDAVLNANYLKARLQDVMTPAFEGYCMHEALFDDRWLADTGVSTLDVAKAMIDEGFHPMTMYFPLVVHGAMLVEPTETESKAELDRFIGAMRALASAAKAGDTERFKGAPFHAPLRRLDETAAARKPRAQMDGGLTALRRRNSMALSMYQASAPVFAHMLGNLSALLAKAQAEVDAGRLQEADLMAASLAPDMFALPRQVQIASDAAKGVVRLAGRDAPAMADTETSLAQLRQRIALTVEFLNSLTAADLDGSEDRDIEIKLRDRTLNMKGQAFLLSFVTPNFYFHVTTAYAILRSKGVPIGKPDFLGGA